MDKNNIDRREFLRTTAAGMAAIVAGPGLALAGCSVTCKPERKPNVVYIFADQWRAQSTGYFGNTDVMTPNVDKLASQSVNMTRAVSCCPVCSPYRASLMTGQYPLTTGVFLNDVDFKPKGVTLSQAYKDADYNTAYIGKWHLAGAERSAFIPKEKRHSFDFWMAAECVHSYAKSSYYGDKPVKKFWDGYDAIDQTKHACKYISDHSKDDKSFFLVLSWGPPHWPFDAVPEKYKKMYKDKNLKLRLNVPKYYHAQAREKLAGYYANITALDDCMGQIVQTLEDAGLNENTILVFTSDHGDMLYSQGFEKKQKPWDESILIPFLVRYPAVLGKKPRKIDMPFNSPDVMPTLLGLSGIKVPGTVEGKDYSEVLKGTIKPANDSALIMCPWPFAQFMRGTAHPKFGPTWAFGREYRGIRTRRYTYVRDLRGSWLLYDNENDPYQLDNLANKPEYVDLETKLDKILKRKLKETNDEFLNGEEYIKKWGHKVNEVGEIPWNW